MEKRESSESMARSTRKRLIIVGAVILVIMLVLLLITQLTTPKRSVAAYCQIYKSEKARLAALPGDTWPSGVFNEAVGDAGEFAAAFSRLEKVAPDEIRPDIVTLQLVYQSIDDNPAGAISASLSGTGAETSVKEWTKNHCTE